tara:strand:- start:1664 stop:2020 length:357 start_codon:yes stop_codon:yes gene_type:complete
MPIFGVKQVDKTLSLVDKVLPNTQKTRDFKMELIKLDSYNDDLFSRRARPMVVYFGLFVFFFELFGLRIYLASSISEDALKSSNEVLKYFITIWGSVVGLYSVGKSFGEKKGRKFLSK